MTDTTITNVCSRGFGIKVLREGRPGDTKDPADFYVDHLICPNDTLPVDPPKLETYNTVLDNQSGVDVVLMEQAGTKLSEDMEHNNQLEHGEFALSGTDPVGTPIQVSIGMDKAGILTITASHPAVPDLTFTAKSEGAVLSQEQIAESASKVQAVRRA
jgi:molecular chaperone DnaK (HSP70)